MTDHSTTAVENPVELLRDAAARIRRNGLVAHTRHKIEDCTKPFEFEKAPVCALGAFEPTSSTDAEARCPRTLKLLAKFIKDGVGDESNWRTYYSHVIATWSNNLAVKHATPETAANWWPRADAAGVEAVAGKMELLAQKLETGVISPEV